jgi:hypothetical protein
MIRKGIKVEQIDPFGKPDFIPGDDPGFFIWQNKENKKWQVRWNGDNIYNEEFKGIMLTERQLQTVKPVSFEQDDFFESNNTLISFYGNVRKYYDGLTFVTISQEGFVYFDILEDNDYQPINIFIGREKISPTTVPFIIENTIPNENINTNGRPVYTIGKKAGYFIWQDSAEKDWHIRWNGDGNDHYFKGTIRTDGLIKKVKKRNYEAEDSLDRDDTTINFEGFANIGIDGLDFSIQPVVSWVVFDIIMDGRYQSEYIFIGKENTNPSITPFKIDPYSERE